MIVVIVLLFACGKDAPPKEQSAAPTVRVVADAAQPTQSVDALTVTTENGIQVVTGEAPRWCILTGGVAFGTCVAKPEDCGSNECRQVSAYACLDLVRRTQGTRDRRCFMSFARCDAERVALTKDPENDAGTQCAVVRTNDHKPDEIKFYCFGSGEPDRVPSSCLRSRESCEGRRKALLGVTSLTECDGHPRAYCFKTTAGEAIESCGLTRADCDTARTRLIQRKKKVSDCAETSSFD